jgi:hypothetical protein
LTRRACRSSRRIASTSASTITKDGSTTASTEDAAARRPRATAPRRARAATPQPRVVIAWLLLIIGVAWATARGLHFYGLTPVDAGYDLDQPPLLLVLVAGWLMIRSHRP